MVCPSWSYDGLDIINYAYISIAHVRFYITCSVFSQTLSHVFELALFGGEGGGGNGGEGEGGGGNGGGGGGNGGEGEEVMGKRGEEVMGERGEEVMGERGRR